MIPQGRYWFILSNIISKYSPPLTSKMIILRTIGISKSKCLKSNNGSECSSLEFVDYFIDHGIRMLKMVPRHLSRMTFHIG